MVTSALDKLCKGDIDALVSVEENCGVVFNVYSKTDVATWSQGDHGFTTKEFGGHGV